MGRFDSCAQSLRQFRMPRYPLSGNIQGMTGRRADSLEQGLTESIGWVNLSPLTLVLETANADSLRTGSSGGELLILQS